MKERLTESSVQGKDKEKQTRLGAQSPKQAKSRGILYWEQRPRQRQREADKAGGAEPKASKEPTASKE